jgi:hypothetical protein
LRLGALQGGMSSESSNENDKISIGRIPLKQVRVSRSEREKEPRPNPMNNLVPYLDLFCRLDDAELARLGGVEVEVVASLRSQVDAVNDGLALYLDLLPRLSDSELVRLTGASDRTIRFWRLCQPGIATNSKPVASPPAAAPAAAAEAGVPEPTERSATVPHSTLAASVSENTGRFPSAAAMGGDRQGSGSGYVTLSGAPFPGFDDEAGAETAPHGAGLDGVTLDGDPDPLGLGET